MNIDVLPILKIAPIFLVALASPGPDFLLISSLAMRQGRSAGIMAAAGITIGVVIYCLFCVFGLGYVLVRMAWLLTVIKIGGGLYLIYLAYQLWRSSLVKIDVTDAVADLSQQKSPFLMGLTTNATNPKALAFFTSVFALVLKPETTIETQIIVILCMGLMAFSWFSFVTFGLSTARVRGVYMRSAKCIDRVAGTFLALFGLKLIVSAQN